MIRKMTGLLLVLLLLCAVLTACTEKKPEDTKPNENPAVPTAQAPETGNTPTDPAQTQATEPIQQSSEALAQTEPVPTMATEETAVIVVSGSVSIGG